jgi:hypothetical protein
VLDFDFDWEEGPMKKTLTAVLLGTALLVSAGSVSGATPAYKHYVACGVSEKAKPSHSCPKKSKKGAFFKSLKGDVAYTVCVRFPTKKAICTEEPQEARQGTLYVNKITSNIPGKHRVTWFVGGKRVGSFIFRVTG